MDTETRILTLATKKLGKEADQQELAELDMLLGKNPGIKNSLKNIFTLWEIVDLDIMLTEQEIDDNIDVVFNRIHRQINGAKNVADKADN
jgi:hypothetical protein